MALTLVEAAKLHSGNIFRSAIIEIYAQSSGILRVLPFLSIKGNSYKYNQEHELPGVGFRGVNEAYPESTGILNPHTEGLVISGGDIDVDKFIVSTMGSDQRSVQEAMKIKALSLAWERTFIKGDSYVEPREFDGLQKRITGRQLMDAGNSSGGDPLSLFDLDNLIALVSDPTHILLEKRMALRMTQAARNKDVSGLIGFEKDEFGRQVVTYNGIPMVPIGTDNENEDIIGFKEPAPGGGPAQCTSIYVVSMSDAGVCGLENENIQATDLGELQEKPAYRTRIEWYSGFGIFNGKAAARLRGIKNVPVIA